MAPCICLPRSFGMALLIGAVAAGSAIPVAGCASRSASRDEMAYTGPAVAVDSNGPQHIVVVSAPSAGWQVALDQVKPAVDATEVFVTLTRPNPAYMHAQQIVEQRLASTVQKRDPIRVLARIVDFGASPTAAPYRTAARSSR